MIRPALAGAAVAAVGVALLRVARGRGARRLLDAPRVGPEESSLGPALDALGGEVVRLRARDGLRLAARWLPHDRGEGARSAGETGSEPGSATGWVADPHEAILLLHGYSGSIAPDLVEYGPFLRRTAGVLGLDFRGHGLSDDGPTTFGLLEVEDVAGALAWLGERGITRVALVGTSMGGITAVAAVAVLGDGTLAAADAADDRTVAPVDAPRPRIVAVVGDSVPAELETPIASRLSGPARRFTAGRLFDGAAAVLGADPRATEPARIIALVEPVPLLLIHGDADATVPIEDGRRLAALAGAHAQHWIVPGAEHSASHTTAPVAYEDRVSRFLRQAMEAARAEAADADGLHDMMAPPVEGPGHPDDPASPGED
jgi:pimeloyl-ACP methyl ester carboxylesterase